MGAAGAGRRRRCRVCGGRVKRNGHTSAGRTRWRCTECGSSTTRDREDVSRRAEVTRFVGWLTSAHTQDDAGTGSARSFRRRHAWCWNIEPVIDITGEIYDEVQLDGTYLSGGWCLLLAIDGTTGTVIAWQWCDTEKTAAWTALLTRIPPPRVVVTDGGSGLASALKVCWPQTLVQRCLVHVQRNVHPYLTARPRTHAGRSLRAISLALTRISTRDQAAPWEVRLHEWHQAYAEMINAKTYLRDARTRPAWARANATWWWTHDRLRKAYRLLERLTRQQVLFTYLLEDLETLTISSTTNRIEGGRNAGIKDLLRRHRGMTTDHQRRATEWWCYLHSTKPKPPATFIRPEHWHPPTPTPTTLDEPAGPTGYDIATTADKGLWNRPGWAARTHR
jgi:hypothetical protein